MSVPSKLFKAWSTYNIYTNIILKLFHDLPQTWKKKPVINIISSSCLLGFLEAFHTTQLHRISLIDRIDLEWILNYFCTIVLCTIFGYKNKNSSYSPKFSCKTFSMNIRSRLHSRLWKIDYTKISQKSFIFLFQKLLS